MSKSLQHRSYVSQPKWQLSKANLPQPGKPCPENRTVNPVVVKNKSKPDYLDEFQFIKKLIRGSTIAYNWKLLKPKKLGYILVSSWVPQSKGRKEIEIRSGPLTWGYVNPKDSFIYVGSKTESWKLGKSQSYYNPSYGDYYSESFDILGKLNNPLRQD